MTQEFIVTRRDGVVTATFNRPSARNALTYAMYDGLAALCGSITPDDRVLIITGAGADAFAAGTDIAQFQTLATAADSLAYEARIEVVLSAIERCPVSTIAAIGGACTGGGAAIAGCCDLRIGASNLRYGFPIARTLGNCLSAANLTRLVALMGEARVKDMLLTARLIEAEEAKAIGLVSRVVAPEDLLAEAEAMARTIAGLAPLTIAATRRALAAAKARRRACGRSGAALLPERGFPRGRRGVWGEAKAGLVGGMIHYCERNEAARSHCRQALTEPSEKGKYTDNLKGGT